MQVPVDLSRDEAHRLAVRELSKAIYRQHQPDPLTRLIDIIGTFVGRLLNATAGTTPSGWIGLLVVAVLVVGLIVLVRTRAGSLARSRRSKAVAVLDDRTARRDAAGLRAEAGRLADAEEWAEAIRARMRAVALGLEERALLDHRPGRTAEEIADDAAGGLPGRADDLHAAARVFADVWYGGRPATRTGYTTIAEADDRIRETRPALAGSTTAGSGTAGGTSGGTVGGTVGGTSGGTSR